MKKIIAILILTIILIGCTLTNDAALKFKSDYESLNGKESKSGKTHRSVSINPSNPFEEITAKELIKKIKDEETFYVYFGDKQCPWCRSVIEKAIEVANDKKIEKIYYIAIWDDNGNEILRDKYELKEKELKKIVDGTEEYYTLLEYFDNVLSDYKLTDDKGKSFDTEEKRIYAPNFIYVKKGKAIRLTEGISESQTDSREKLTKEILKDEEELFNNFFK